MSFYSGDKILALAYVALCIMQLRTHHLLRQMKNQLG